MELKFIPVKTSIQIQESIKIIGDSGIHMYETMNLDHWYPPMTIKEFKEQQKFKEFYLCKKENKFIATFAISNQDSSYPIPIWDNTQKAMFLSKLAVKPNIQHKGIGSECLTYIEILGRLRGKSKILLDSIEKHPHLKKFYLKNGYSFIKKSYVKNKRGKTWEIEQFLKNI